MKKLLVLTLTLFILLMPSCTEVKKEETPQTPSPDATKSDPEQPHHSGGIYKFPLDTEPPVLDPARVTDTVSDKVVRSMFDCLVEISPDGGYAPAVAEKWEANEDGTVWTFYLKQNVKFHNGRTVTADDFAYSFKRVLDPVTASERRWVLDKIKGADAFFRHETNDVEGIEVVDTYTLRLTLDKPFAPFLGLLAMSNASVVPKEVVEMYGAEFATRPEATVGTGPFILREWAPKNYFYLESNKDYFDGAPYVDGLKYIIIPETMSRLEEFRSGNLDHTDIPPELLNDIANDPVESKLIQKTPLIDIYNLGFNCEKPPFKDNIKLRLAFNHAIDRKFLIETVLSGMGHELKSFVPPGIEGYESELPGYEYNEELARKYLAEAGYPEGKGLPTITLYHDIRPPRPQICQVVQQNLKRIGVNIELKPLDWPTFLKAVDNGEPSFFQLTWLADYPDPENFLFVLLHSSQWGAAGNNTRYKNEKFDSLIDQAAVISDNVERFRLYREAEKVAYDDSPWLFLFQNDCTILVNSKVRGLKVTPLDRPPVLPSVEIEKVWFVE